MSKTIAAASASIAALLALAGCSQETSQPTNNTTAAEEVPPVTAGCQTPQGSLQISLAPDTGAVRYEYTPTTPGGAFRGSVGRTGSHMFYPQLGYVSADQIPDYYDRKAANDAQRAFRAKPYGEAVAMILNPDRRLTDIYGLPSVSVFCRGTPGIEAQISAVVAALPAGTLPAPSPAGTQRR